MSTDVTDSAQSIFLEPNAHRVLAYALHPCLSADSAMTLVLLAVAGASAREKAAFGELQAVLDVIEQATLASVRRTDMVVRCGFFCCALALPGTGIEGAQIVVNRLRSRLKGCITKRPALLVGLAAIPEHAGEVEALIVQACRRSTCLVLPEEQASATWNAAERAESPAVLTPPRRGAISRRSVRMIRRIDAGLPTSAEPGYNAAWRRSHQTQDIPQPPATFVQARALALGVPYLTPPQSIPTSVRNLLPPEVMEQMQCLPVGRERNVLTVALADPTDRGILHQLEQMTGMTIFPVMTDPDVLKALSRPARARRVSQAPAASTSRTSR